MSSRASCERSDVGVRRYLSLFELKGLILDV